MSDVSAILDRNGRQPFLLTQDMIANVGPGAYNINPKQKVQRPSYFSVKNQIVSKQQPSQKFKVKSLDYMIGPGNYDPKSIQSKSSPYVSQVSRYQTRTMCWSDAMFGFPDTGPGPQQYQVRAPDTMLQKKINQYSQKRYAVTHEEKLHEMTLNTRDIKPGPNRYNVEKCYDYLNPTPNTRLQDRARDIDNCVHFHQFGKKFIGPSPQEYQKQSPKSTRIEKRIYINSRFGTQKQKQKQVVTDINEENKEKYFEEQKEKYELKILNKKEFKYDYKKQIPKIVELDYYEDWEEMM
ncbi:Conserved_hypothetical protein [Hexamita inflata]|uniref:Sperm-tail PG-rich repeat protein n=1 Tax=Hexamita inflata TaxID=28002 RepID=A0AA86UJJ0_9EUKA|nr:Conserved hypothetical protein [Hexamita inflata]